MTNIYQENAFTLNKLGGGFFPFSLNISQSGPLTRAFVCPQRVVDVCDLIRAEALSHLVLFNVDQVSWYDELEDQPFSLKRIAAEAQLACFALDADAIVLAKEKLGLLLATFSHFNLCAFDIDEKWNETEVIEQVITCKEHAWQSGALILPKLPASTIFIDSHDDCYLSVETCRPAFAQRIFAKMLNLYAGTLLAENQKTPIVPAEIPQAVLNLFWQESFGLTILRETTRVAQNQLAMGVVKRPFNFREEETYVPDFWLCYNWQTGQWVIQNTLL